MKINNKLALILFTSILTVGVNNLSAYTIDYGKSDKINLSKLNNIKKHIRLFYQGEELVFEYNKRERLSSNHYLKPVFLTIEWYDYNTKEMINSRSIEIKPKINIYTDRINTHNKGKTFYKAYINDIEINEDTLLAINSKQKILNLKKYEENKRKLLKLRKLKAEKEARAKKIAEEKAKKEAELKRLAKLKAEKEARAKKIAEEKAKKEAELKRLAKLKAEKEARAKKIAEEKAKKEAELKRLEKEKRLAKIKAKLKIINTPLENKVIKKEVGKIVKEKKKIIKTQIKDIPITKQVISKYIDKKIKIKIIKIENIITGLSKIKKEKKKTVQSKINKEKIIKEINLSKEKKLTSKNKEEEKIIEIEFSIEK